MSGKLCDVEVLSGGKAGPPPNVEVRVGDPRMKLEWRTPGSRLAEALRGTAEVKSVFERVDPDRYTVFVVLENDQESVLDAVFDAEHGLYEEFRKMPFDIRVMRPHSAWDDSGLRASACLRYARP